MSLAERIENKSARVGVIGLGYVGLPLLAAFHRAGFQVIGFDIDPLKIQALSRGENYLKHLGETLVRDMRQAGRFEATTDFGRLAEADAVISCVPTPLGRHLEPDLSYVERTSDDIARTLRKDQLVVLESTTYPGTTRQIVLPRLEARGLRCGTDFYLAYSPEREDPGRKDHSTQTIPKLVGGVDLASGQLATALYREAIRQVIPVSSAEVAEAAKLLENIYRAVNIALVNEMKVVLTAMGINIWEVIAAASTKPFGFQPFYPGPGLGGHCIPIDPYYLTWKARELGLPTRFIELAGEVNHAMPRYVVQRTALALNERGMPVKGSHILVLGLAYKP
ncbi:MAG TPA: nucleotide sugar dehydrogenase, partial [Tepidisphaeraceae bacterium]|nr:nucleotide sugar dehydrogenase [Tepidisphaeraceae bacterium]